MKYYKVNNEIRAIEKGQEFLVQEDWVELSDEELQAELAPSEEELLAQAIAEAKRLKEEALNSITVTTTSGKVFDGREKDQVRMLSAIQSAEVLGLTTSLWKLADNTVAEVSVDEIKEALALSIQAVSSIILGGE